MITDDVKFLLKFGEKKHIEEFVDGSLYCSTAERFWGIEKNKKIKGQGDVLEAGSRIFGQRMTIQKHGSDNITVINARTNMLIHVDPAKNIPVFCMFAVYDSDCSKDDAGNYIISLSENTKDTIKKHFPNADTVAIIENPAQFVQDVVDSIGCRVEKGLVHYFNIDKGFEAKDKNVAMDMEYINYLTQDVPIVKNDGEVTRKFCVDYVYRSLFCKDVFFEKEQEYRIVLPEESISEGKHYPVNLSKAIQMMTLDEFMK